VEAVHRLLAVGGGSVHTAVEVERLGFFVCIATAFRLRCSTVRYAISRSFTPAQDSQQARPMNTPTCYLARCTNCGGLAELVFDDWQAGSAKRRFPHR
jgi:hypothetical protein